MKSKILDSIIRTIQDKGCGRRDKRTVRKYVAVLVLFREKWIISLRNLQKKRNLRMSTHQKRNKNRMHNFHIRQNFTY